MAKAQLNQATQAVTKTVYETTEEVVLTLTVHEAQLIRVLVGKVASEEGNSAMGISDALRDLALPSTYRTGPETIWVNGRRPKEEFVW